MNNIGNVQLVGSIPRCGVLLDKLANGNVQVDIPAAMPLCKAGNAQRLTGGASSEQRFLLNCILSLSKLLAENAGNNLLPKQIDYAQTIYTAGTQLLSYLNRQKLVDTPRVSRPARDQVSQTYHGPRSRHSDGGREQVPGTEVSGAAGLRRSMPELAGKDVLIIDSDILNVYAMTGVLEQQGMIVSHAENSLAGLEILRAQVATDVVILNGGMKGMGQSALIGAIRGIPALTTIPIIAVIPASAHGHRERCIELGASDYIDMPINAEQLLSLMRAWLTRTC